jgi:hypothetical protein
MITVIKNFWHLLLPKMILHGLATPFYVHIESYTIAKAVKYYTVLNIKPRRLTIATQSLHHTISPRCDFYVFCLSRRI